MAADVPYKWIEGLPAEAQRELEINFRKLLDLIAASATASASLGLLGDGSDGVVTFDGTTTVLGFAPSTGVYTLTRDLYLAAGSQIGAGATIKTRSFRIFCTGLLTIAGHVHADGLAPVATTGGQSGGSSAGAGGSTYYTTTNQDGGGGGGFGATGAKSPGGNISNAIGGVGGAGGSASAGGTGTGTTASTVTVPTTAVGGLPRSMVHFVLGGTGPTVTKYEAGTGGTSGASAGSPAATGAGGGAGGICAIFAGKLTNTGTISANGGAGAAATGASGNAGGGGGGGGGAVFIVAGPGSTVGTVTVSGGIGAAGRGTGGTGGTGAAGNIFSLVG